MSVFNRILREKGLLSKYATTGGDADFERANNSNSKENESPNATAQIDMLKELMQNVKHLQTQLDELKSSKTITITQPTPVSGDDTMGRATTNIFQRQHSEPEGKVGGIDSKHSTFSFNNQPMFNNTLPKNLPALEEAKAPKNHQQY
jgi:hypothetical protein